jgi:hypothetical protein
LSHRNKHTSGQQPYKKHQQQSNEGYGRNREHESRQFSNYAEDDNGRSWQRQNREDDRHSSEGSWVSESARNRGRQGGGGGGGGFDREDEHGQEGSGSQGGFGNYGGSSSRDAWREGQSSQRGFSGGGQDRDYEQRSRFDTSWRPEPWQAGPLSQGLGRRSSDSGTGFDESGESGWGSGRQNYERSFSESGRGGRSSEGPHSGRGPKGYQRSDERVREDICDRLTEHGHIDASEIEVTVKNGEVTLNGSVENRQMKHMIEDLVDAVGGVKDVQNHLRVAKSEEGSRRESSQNGEQSQKRGTVKV